MITAALPAPRDDWALFLDFDGTLVEIAESPEAVKTEHHLIETLEALAGRLNGAVAIVSGRPISEVDSHLDHARFPAAGLHGLEFRLRSGGLVSRREGVRPDAELTETLRALANAHDGLLLEDKGLAVALHYRNRPDLAGVCLDSVRTAVRDRPGFQVLEGKMVVEVKSSAANKGQAVKRFMAEPPFAGRVPVFAGDDVTDEDGFRTVRALGGFGIKIGDGDTDARWRIGSVADFLHWLMALPDRMGSEPDNGRTGEVIDR